MAVANRTYIDDIQDRVYAVFPYEEIEDPTLIRYYALLVLTLGSDITEMNVHDAWSLWKNNASIEDRQHPSLVPFHELSQGEKDKDWPFAESLRRIARGLGL